MTIDNGTPHPATLADLEKKSGWICWQDGDPCYARRPQTPQGQHDARGDNPADLCEAIVLALGFDYDIPAPASTPA